MICHNIIERAIVNAGIGKMGPNGIEGVTPKVKTIAIPDPAAGQELSYTVPSGVVLLVKVFYGLLVTDATVTTRYPNLDAFDASGRQLFRITYPGGRPANQNNRVAFFSGAVRTSGGAYGDTNSMPADLILLPGWEIRTATSGMQAGDQWSNGTIYCIEWS